MCIIIDTNKLALFLKEPPDKDMQPVHDWLNRRGGSLVYSNSDKFSKEISGRARRRLDEYLQSGKAKLIHRSKVEEKSEKLNRRLMKSDDSHIVALALAADVRLLCTGDTDLMDDFTNYKIMGTGNKGKIYSSAKNKDLLNRDTCP